MLHHQPLTEPPTAIPAAPRRRIPVWIWLLVVAASVAAAATGVLRVTRMIEEINRPVPLPRVPPVDVFSHFFDMRPLRVTTTAGWQKITITVPRHDFLSDPTMWRRMHFEDWDRLPSDVRKVALQRMLYPYWYLIPWPRHWACMTANDWDSVPQPVRAMASLGMIEYWVDFYGVGQSFDLPRREVLRTVQAIAMSESWFDHRAEFRYSNGELDIGMAGASPFARRTIRRWYARSLTDFTFSDEDYYNPWHASRFLAFWFQVMLEEADGDLDLAVRAYNTGIGRAMTQDGDDYLKAVMRRRARYLEGRPSRSASWRFLLQERHQLLVAAALARRHTAPSTGDQSSGVAGGQPKAVRTVCASRSRVMGLLAGGDLVRAEPFGAEARDEDAAPGRPMPLPGLFQRRGRANHARNQDICCRRQRRDDLTNHMDCVGHFSVHVVQGCQRP